MLVMKNMKGSLTERWLTERNWNVLKIPEMFVNIKFMLKWRNELTQQIFMNWHKEFTLFSFCILKNNFCWFVWFLNIRMGCNFVGFHFNAVHFLVVYPHWVSLWCIKMQIETFVSFIVLCSHTDKQYDNMNEHTNGIEMTIKIFEAVENDVTKALTKNFNCIKCVYIKTPGERCCRFALYFVLNATLFSTPAFQMILVQIKYAPVVRAYDKM